MSDCLEVYADQMTLMSIGNGGTIAKLVFSSNVPDTAGQVVQNRTLVVTMPVNQLQRMLREIRGAGVESDAPATALASSITRGPGPQS